MKIVKWVVVKRMKVVKWMKVVKQQVAVEQMVVVKKQVAVKKQMVAELLNPMKPMDYWENKWEKKRDWWGDSRDWQEQEHCGDFLHRDWRAKVN